MNSQVELRLLLHGYDGDIFLLQVPLRYLVLIHNITRVLMSMGDFVARFN